MPTRSPELTKAERLRPIGKPETGVMQSVDAGWLAAVSNRLAEAIGAVTRGNIRAAGNKAANRCVKAVFETGITPASCSGP